MSNTGTDDLEALKTILGALSGLAADDQERVLRWVREKLGLSSVATASPQVSAPLAALGAPARATDIKSFVDAKKPQSDMQFAAVVAYYYRFEAPEAQRKNSITKEDLQEATRRAGRSRLNHPGQTLINAHQQGYLDKGDEAGTYQINTVGENLVAVALPEGSASNGAASRPQRRTQRASRKRKTKRGAGNRRK